MSIETDIQRLGDLGQRLGDFGANDPTWPERRLRDVGQPSPAPTRLTGATVLEALAKLDEHARGILSNARALESGLIGESGSDNGLDYVDKEGGIWDRLAAKIVVIERVFSAIDEAHNHAQASLK